MSDNSQFYADNEKSSDGQESTIDLSFAYEIRSNIVPEDEWKNQKIVFFCRDCDECVDAKKNKKSMTFTCNKCNGKRIAFGTEKSVQNFFRLHEKK
jgi:Zn finger protein HypA/HybF involved in hydrogenase expression